MDKIEELLTRGVEEIIDKENLEKKLKSGKVLRIKLGIDPTSPNIHLGRSVALLKLRDFQNLGHTAVFIVGDFTGLVGDASDKDSERPMLTEDQVKSNMKTYSDQALKILDPEKTEIHYNSEWLKKLGFLELAKMANLFGLHEFTSRDVIARRMKEGKRVSYHEVLYPLMQGYDSVAINADVELGGIDQRFNLLTGRTLQKFYKQEPQDIMMVKYLEGADGRKMSSSWGNVINIMDGADDMFGKLMSLEDRLIIKYFELTTRVSTDGIKEFETELKKGANPRGVKLKLAHEIVKMYHGEKVAAEAQSNWENVFSKKEIPDNIPEIKSAGSILSSIVSGGIVGSKTQARRLFEEGAIEDLETKNKITDPETKVSKPLTLKIGKKKFVRIKV